MLAYDGLNLPVFPPSHKNTAFSQLKTHRRIFVYKFCTISDETNRLHTCVRKTCIAGKFRETFDGVLEGVDGCREIFLKDGCWRDKRRKIFSLLVFRLYYPYWQYTDLFIFRFVSLLCLRSTLRLINKPVV